MDIENESAEDVMIEEENDGQADYSREIDRLNDEVARLEAKILDNEYAFRVVEEMLGESREDIFYIAKMAKGVAADGAPIEEAVKAVVRLVGENIKKSDEWRGVSSVKPETPNSLPEKSPFEFGGNFNLTEQGKIFMENPKAAKGFFKFGRKD
ncbi:MAG: hypothetical protein LBL35_09320 [Clostridiales bacterium]|nr:hypothetical protein [Clostridiales bacterium]